MMFRFSWLSAISFFLLMGLEGCEVGPDYTKPEMALPDRWTETNSTTDVQASQAWWKSLNDPTLNQLIDKALANNQNRQIAEARIREARGRRLNAAAAQYPQIGVDATAAHTNPGVLTENMIYDFWQPQLDATFEIDLFGGTRRNIEAQDALVAAAEASYQDYSLSLVAEVASEYTTWRELQNRADLTRQTVTAQKNLYDLNQVRYQAGLTSELDMSQAETLYRTTKTQLPLIERQLADTGFRLTLLLGETPGAENAALTAAKPIPAFTHLPGLSAPASLIEQRPDVKTAERNLAAATALKGVAISELYPKINVAALFGYQNTNLLPAIAIYELAGELTMPILNFGRIDGQIDVADAKQEQAFHAYQQTVLAALSDVETHLADYAREQKRLRDLRAVVGSSAHTLALARERYDKGLSPFLDVLNAQEALYNTQIEFVTATANMTRYAIALSKSLGVY